MKMLRTLKALAAAAILSLPLASCQEDVSDIGTSLIQGEVTITVDSLATPVKAETQYVGAYDARTLTKLLGRINVPEYGRLDCSFVSQLLAATRLTLPDSIQQADSMRLMLTVPRGALTGDSLAPQQLRAYRLTSPLPDSISSDYDPRKHQRLDASNLLGSASYTLSNIANDSLFHKQGYIRIPVKMPETLKEEVFRKYRANDPIFQWPATFNDWFKGIYVEQNFGNGCIARISGAEMLLYWTSSEQVYEKTGTDSEGKDIYEYVTRAKRDSICVFASQPEVLSSNIISYDMAESLKERISRGETIITSPGGTMAEIRFPVDDLLNKFESTNNGVSVVSSLRFQIPANTVRNDHGIGVAPWLLMVKASEREEFFKNNRVPDGKTSFYAAYNSTLGCYQFNGMRSYFLDMLERKQRGETVSEEDMTFTILPVLITTESQSNYNSTTEYVTRCAPYVAIPTMTQLHTDRAVICFTFSSQEIE